MADDQQREKWRLEKRRTRGRKKSLEDEGRMRLVATPKERNMELMAESVGLSIEAALENRTLAELMERLAVERAEELLASKGR